MWWWFAWCYSQCRQLIGWVDRLLIASVGRYLDLNVTRLLRYSDMHTYIIYLMIRLMPIPLTGLGGFQISEEFWFLVGKGSLLFIRCIRWTPGIYLEGALVIFQFLAYTLFEKYATHFDFWPGFETWMLQAFWVLLLFLIEGFEFLVLRFLGFEVLDLWLILLGGHW